VARCLESLERMYRVLLTDHGSPSRDLAQPAHQMMMAIINRVLGLGVVAIDRRAWWAIPELVIRRPDVEQFRSGFYTNWVRHTTTAAANADALHHTQEDGRRVRTAYLEHTISDIASVGCLNSDAPHTDRLRDRLAQVDALATMAVWGLAPGDRDHPYYPWHRAYEPHRYEPALVELLTDAQLRAAVFPGDDPELARLLVHLQRFSTAEFAGFDGGWPYMAVEIRDFLDRNMT
jgi:hypothetical protein